MKTYRINKEDLKNKEALTEGYKIFKKGFVARDYCYADENNNVVGTFHRVDGNIKECSWGLHFSKNPFHCFNFYESVQWNEFAKVRAYEQVIDSSDGDKTVAQVLEIVETYTFDEFIDILRQYNKELYCSDGVNASDGVNRSDGVNASKGVNNSYGIINCEGVSRCIFCLDISGKLNIFNKDVSQERFLQVMGNIRGFNWQPQFNNAFCLKKEQEEWFNVNIPGITKIDNKTAWSTMPKEMKEYIQSLKEYDENIFNKITGELEEDD